MTKRRPLYSVSALAILMILCLTLDLFAQPEYMFEVSSRYSPAQDARAMPGDVALSDVEMGCVYENKLFDKLPLKLSLRNQYKGIDSSAALWLPAHLVKLSSDLEATLPFFTLENMFLRIGVTPSLCGDDWNFAPSEFRLPLRLAAIYKPNEVWIFVAGVAVFPDFEKMVFPVFGFIYTPNERLSVNFASARPSISYALNGKVTIFSEWGFFLGEYEVQKDSLQSAVLAYREIRVGAGMRYKINEHLQSVFSTGAMLNRTFQYRDSLGKVSIDDGMYSEVKFEARF